MGLMGCLGCPGEYETGLRACPWCGMRSPMFVEGEDGMPKVTTGGASNAWEAAQAEGAESVAAEAPAELEAAPVPADAETVTVVVGEPGPELANLAAGNVVSAPKVAAAAKKAAKKAAPAVPAAGAEQPEAPQGAPDAPTPQEE